MVEVRILDMPSMLVEQEVILEVFATAKKPFCAAQSHRGGEKEQVNAQDQHVLTKEEVREA